MEQEWKSTGEKNVVAIWTCFLLFSRCFQIGVCLGFVFCFALFGFFFVVVVDMWMTLLIILTAYSVRLGLSSQVLLFGVTAQKLYSIIRSNLGHSTSYGWFFMPQVLKWFLLFSKTKLNSNEKVNVLENYSKWNKIAFC